MAKAGCPPPPQQALQLSFRKKLPIFIGRGVIEAQHRDASLQSPPLCATSISDRKESSAKGTGLLRPLHVSRPAGWQRRWRSPCRSICDTRLLCDVGVLVVTVKRGQAHNVLLLRQAGPMDSPDFSKAVGALVRLVQTQLV